MGLTVRVRHPYDDVALIGSTDPDADLWKLEVLEEGQWRSLPPQILDSHMNWSTQDLTLWHELRGGDPSVIQRVFPTASKVIPAEAPFAVTWNISAWWDLAYAGTGQPIPFRFTGPGGVVFRFDSRSSFSWPEHRFE